MEPIKLRDFLDYKCLGGIEISPNGEYAAFVAYTADLDANEYPANIWVINLAEKKLRQLTSGGRERGFLWLDDDTLIFPSLRGGVLKKELEDGEAWTVYYTISLKGGEAVEYMRIPLIVTDIKALDSDNFILTANCRAGGIDLHQVPPEDRAEAVRRLKEEKDYEVIDEVPYVMNGRGYVNKMRNRLYRFCRATGVLTPLTEPLCNVDFFRCENGKVLYAAKTYEHRMPRANILYEYDLANGETRLLLPAQGQHIAYAAHVGGRLIAKMCHFDLDAPMENMQYYQVCDGTATLFCKDDTGFGNAVGSDCRYGGVKPAKVDGDKFYALCTWGYDSFVSALAPDGALHLLTPQGGTIDAFDIRGDTMVYVAMRGNRLEEVYMLQDGVETRLTSFNEEIYTGKSHVTPEHFVYTSDGVELDGFVLKPVGFEESGRYPAILDIHGGPKAAYGTCFYHEMQLWANLGYFVVFTNTRGSEGKGGEFAELRGEFGTVDYDDFMAFADTVLERYPQIDKDNFGVTGGSYGGYMSNWIIGHTDRFKCAATQRSISNWATMLGLGDLGTTHTLDQTRSTPWDNPQRMWDHSPLKYAPSFKTPTLIIHSDQDYRCPLAEGMQLMTALKYFGTEARMVIFKGENHELSRSGKPSHRIRRLEEITSWFEKYLKN